MAESPKGYKERLSRRRSGNPKPGQMWVPVGSPLAARPVTEQELRAERARQRRFEIDWSNY